MSNALTALTKDESERFHSLRAVIQFGKDEALRREAGKQYAALLDAILRRQRQVAEIQAGASN
jgi:hypothetical protein